MKILLFLPFPVLFFGISYWADPANVFARGAYEAGIASLMHQGKHVSNVYNYDERLLQKFFLEKLSRSPQLIVIGSSRGMQIASDNIPCFKVNTFLNSCVSSPTIEDYLAIYNLYRKKGHKPQKLVMVFDHFLFYGYNEGRWESIKEEYEQMKQLLEIEEAPKITADQDWRVRWNALFSVDYFQQSLAFLLKGKSNRYFPTEQVENEEFTRLNDGSIFYDRTYRSRSVPEVENLALNTFQKYPISNTDKPRKLVKADVEKLIRFIEKLQEEKIEVYFFLAPYHPVVYEQLLQTTYYEKNIAEMETYFNELARSQGIGVIGSFDPRKCGVDETHFYDGMHCSKEAISKILSNIPHD